MWLRPVEEADADMAAVADDAAAIPSLAATECTCEAIGRLPTEVPLGAGTLRWKNLPKTVEEKSTISELRVRCK